jgi:NADH:ubiquinone oxidoreductase subunit C
VNAHPYDSLPDAVTEIFGEESTAERTYELLTVDVPAGSWIASLEIARDKLGCTYFDWLSAVDEPGTGFRVCAHVVSLEGRTVRRLLIRTTVPHAAPSLPSAVDVYAGASWHERETHEMFGVDFTGHPNQVPLLLPETFEGHPLRKDFVLAARVAKAWPGAKEPGESEHGGPKRRQMLPPGVPDPNEWGPLKGQLPPAPARPARGRAAAAGAGAGAGAAGTGERPARRARSVSEGSASQSPATPRRARSASEGSASQAEAAAPAGPAAPSAPPAPPEPSGATDAARPQAGPRSADAPWHHARPAFGDTGTEVPVDPGASTGETGSAGTGAEGPGPAPDATGQDDASASEVSVSEAPAPGPDDASAPEAPASEVPVPGPDDADASADAPASERGASRPETDRPASGSDDGPDDEPNRPAGGEPA